MTFYRWLITQKDRADRVGVLSRCARRDPTAPIDGSPGDWIAYLSIGSAMPTALQQALEEFENAHTD